MGNRRGTPFSGKFDQLQGFERDRLYTLFQIGLDFGGIQIRIYDRPKISTVMKNESLVILVFLVLGLSSFYGRRASVLPVPDMSVAELEEKLGGEINPNRPNTDLEGVSAETGRKLIFEGKADPPGSILQSSRRISKYFTCNACHN